MQPKPNERIHRIECPVCKKKGDWLAGAHGPFCSHRCRLIDLGKWPGGGHVISEPLRPEHFEKYAGLPPGEHLDLPEAQGRLQLLNLKNIQQPTSNIERPTVAAGGFVGCWVLDVRCSMFPS